MTRKVFVYMALWKEGDKFEMSCKTKAFGDYREAVAELRADAKEVITCFSMAYGDGNYTYTCVSSDHATCLVEEEAGMRGDMWEAWIEALDVDFGE